MNLHSGSGTSPVSFLPGDFLLTLTLMRRPIPPEEPPLPRGRLGPSCRDARAPEGSALRGGAETPARGPGSSTCRAEGEAAAASPPPPRSPVFGAPLSGGSPPRPCEGRTSWRSGRSSPDSCRRCTSASRWEACSPAWRAGGCIWCAAPARRARGSCPAECCVTAKESAQSWRQTSGTGPGWENIHRG